MNESNNTRSYDESCRLLDKIVGRCVRDASFASRVLDHPESALSDYDLNEDELEDFVVLQAHHRDEAGTIWAAIRDGMEATRRHGLSGPPRTAG